MIRSVDPYPMSDDEVIARQDYVDNAIFDLIQKVSLKELDWDIEMIGRIRDELVSVISEKTGISEESIYP